MRASRFLAFLAVLLPCLTVGAQDRKVVSDTASNPSTQTKLVTTAPSASNVVAINPFAFEGLEAADIDALRASGVARYCDAAEPIPWGLEAPVELPEGTLITRFELDAHDNDSSNLNATLYRCPVGAVVCDEVLAQVTTDLTPGFTTVGVDLIPPSRVTNREYSYFVEVYPGEDEETRLLGVRLEVTGPESHDPDDTLALHSYAFEGRSIADRSVLAAVNIQRYCNGSSCELVAPVELPSGATIHRIELDAFDNSPDDVVAELVVCDFVGATCSSLGTVGTNGTPQATQPEFSFPSSVTVDNTSSTYIVQVSLGTTSATRLAGVRLDVDLPTSAPRYDRLTISPFAFESEESSDSEVLDSEGGERFCLGQGCTMLAPVDLPNGARVGRLELSAWDMSSDQVRAAFLRCAKSSETCVEVAARATTGTPGSTVTGVDITPPEAVDNAAFSYTVEVRSGPNADTALRGVSLTIENSSIFNDGFGGGNTAAWSRAVP